MSCRLDKFVWCVRLVKTRSLATQVIGKGKIRLNEATAKPSKEVRLGDEIQIIKNTAAFTFRIIQLLNKRVGAKLVSDYIIDITPEEEKEKFRFYQTSQNSYKASGKGKPSTKDRRDLEDFMEDWD